MKSAVLPKVSVVVPAFNASGYILKALDSIMNQSYQRIEIIVVDDGSTDNTQAILNDLIAKETISYIYQENKGAAAARNTGIRASSGEYIGFLDSDDSFESSMVSCCVNSLMANNSDLVSVDNYRVFYSGEAETKREVQEYAWIEKPPDELFLTFLEVGGIGGIHKAIFKRSVFDKIGFLDETLPVYEDLDFWIRVAMNGLSWDHLRKPLLFYSKRSDEISLFTRSSELNQDCRIRIMKKYKSEAIRRSPRMKEVFAEQLWNFGRAYLMDYDKVYAALDCFLRSVITQPSIIRVKKSAKNMLLSRKTK